MTPARGVAAVQSRSEEWPVLLLAPGVGHEGVDGVRTIPANGMGR